MPREHDSVSKRGSGTARGDDPAADQDLSAADGREPVIAPDSKRLLENELHDRPHAASRFEASDGAGTVSGPPRGERLQEHPVLDGSTESAEAEASTPNPTRGMSDPAMVSRQPSLTSSGTNRWLLAGNVAAVLMVTVLLLLARFAPLLTGIGIVATLVLLMLMLVVRARSVRLGTKLKEEALLLWLLWVVPLAIVGVVLFQSAAVIWP